MMKSLQLGALMVLGMAGATAALAADMPVKARPMPVAVYSWAGWYVGGNAGYSWGRARTDVGFATFPAGVPIVPPAGSVTSGRANLNGFVGGGQVGYNAQSGQWVGGLEADIQFSDEKGTSNFLCAATAGGGVCFPGATFLPAGAAGTTLSLQQKIDWFGTVRGRVGWTPTPTWLLYGTGGLAYGGVKTNGVVAGTLANVFPAGTPTAAVGSQSNTQLGWTLGAGVEGVISGPWTAKLEYLYMDLGNTSGTFVNPTLGVAANYRTHVTDNILRGGINYRFAH
jgi:outer membrane immunogenic protein